MSRTIDHSKNYEIMKKYLEETQKVYPLPDLDAILPPNLDAIEDKMTEQEFNKFVTKKFNLFYSKFINTREKELFVCLPIEFFTAENIDRVRRYANIAMFIKTNCADSSHEATFYNEIHERILKMLKKKSVELKNKRKHEEPLIVR